MIDPREDQAAGLRRLFRRSPPAVVALYAAGARPAELAIEAAHRLASPAHRVLLLDEARGAASLAPVLGLPDGIDLLGVLGDGRDVQEFVQPVPGLVGRVPVAAAALALRLLDAERRARLADALRSLQRHAGFVLVHSACAAAADPSPFVLAAPRRLVVAEASRRGATDAYGVIKQLAAAGIGSLHVAVCRARDRADANAFFAALDALVQRHVGVRLAWLGEIERDDCAAGLAAAPARSSPREAEAAFLRQVARGAAPLAPVPGGRR